jgi:hypothetical protein
MCLYLFVVPEEREELSEDLFECGEILWVDVTNSLIFSFLQFAGEFFVLF